MARNDPARLKLLFPNYVPDATLSGGQWAAGDLSLDALKDLDAGRVARTLGRDPSGTFLDITFDRLRTIGGLAVLNHNLSVGASLILQGFRDAARLDPVYNGEGVAVEVYPRAYSRGQIRFGETNWWSRKPLAESLGRVRTLALLILQAQTRARYWRLKFVDPTNGAGFLDIGKVYMGPLFDPPHNYAYGATLTPMDESRMSQALSGFRDYDRRGKRRRLAVTFQNMKEKTEFSRFFDLAADAGITEEMIVIRNPADTINLHRTTICATLREPTALEQSVYLRMNAGFVWEEVL